jgi:hypothetical protein
MTMAVNVRAQTSAPPVPAVQDPLMNLMISQPKIDTSAPVKASAVFDPPVVRPGEQAIYRVTFNALEESIDWPSELAYPRGLQGRPGAHGRIFQMTGSALIPLTSFNSRVRASAAGQFTIPEFVVQVYGKPVTVPSTQLNVASDVLPLSAPVTRLVLDVSSTNLFVGQPLPVRVLLPASSAGMIQGLQQVQLNGEGFVVDQGAANVRIDRIQQSGASLQAYVFQTMLIPISAGQLSVFAQGFTAGMHFAGPITGPITITAAPPQFTLLETDPVELSVRPLPHEGQLPGFTGAIGSFGVGPPALASNALRVGEPVTLSVTITNRGETNLGRLVPPPPPDVREWQVLAATSDGAPPQLIQARGFATFTYTLIPLTEEARSTPPIPFSYFDPKKEAYADLTIPSLPVTVKPGAVSGDLSSLLQTGPSSNRTEKEPALSGLARSSGRTARTLVPLQRQAWFPLVQLAPAAAFFGLWGWDRRRRFLERHPEIVLRRRARRGLRREQRALRRAARTGDSKGFAAAAVKAMRVVCAPHYPAEPRALVCGDVLEILQDDRIQQTEDESECGHPGDLSLSPPDGESARERGTSNLVRRFFAVTDASQFSTAAPDATELLKLHTEVEQVLDQLEAKL